MYEKVKELTCNKGYKTGKAIKTSEGKVVMETEKVMGKWSEYISELFMDDRPANVDINYNVEGPPIMEEKVQAALEKMKAGKAVGDDGIAVEMLKALGDFAIEKITEIANIIYDNGEVTTHMCKSIFIAIPKIQGTLECEKHRTINIMSQITKILLWVFLERIGNKIKPQISEEQYGFVKGKGTRNAVFTLRMVIEKTLETDKELYLCFVDYEKAFDRVKREELIKILHRLEIDWKDLRLIKNLCLGAKSINQNRE